MQGVWLCVYDLYTELRHHFLWQETLLSISVLFYSYCVVPRYFFLFFLKEEVYTFILSQGY